MKRPNCYLVAFAAICGSFVATSMADAIHDAVERDDLETLAELLDAGADVNATSEEFGLTALHLAVFNGSVGAADLLIENGADVNLADPAGLTPLRRASMSGFDRMASLLIEHGAVVGEEPTWAQIELKEYLTAGDVATICVSTRAENVEFCDGYFTRVLHHSKIMTSCASEDAIERSYCDGAEAADEAMRQARADCPDCSPSELRDSAALCVREEQPDGYCAGYEAALPFALVTLPGPEASVAENAADRVEGEMFGHAWAGDPSLSIEHCVAPDVSVHDFVGIFLDFVDRNSSERRETALSVAAKAQFYGLCSGLPIGIRPNLEQCTKFTHREDRLSTINACDQAVVVRVLPGTDTQIERVLEPGEELAIELSRSIEWLSTTCPVGYESSIPLLEDNWEPIGDSLFGCVAE